MSEQSKQPQTIVELEIELPSLQEMIEDLLLDTRSYSGRYMGGKFCLGVTVESEEEMTMLFYDLGLEIGTLLGKIRSLGQVDESLFDQIERERRRELKAFRTDHLGKNIIIYWPQIARKDA